MYTIHYLNPNVAKQTSRLVLSPIILFINTCPHTVNIILKLHPALKQLLELTLML